MKDMNDVALAYLKDCFKENLTDEWKIYLELGRFEGVRFDDEE